jgi:TatD DNase family protein
VIDFHCHLDLYKDPASVIKRAARDGVYVLSVTTTPKAWPGTRRLAEGQKRIQTALGLHPQVAHERENELSLFDMLLAEAKYVGEIGLDGSPEYLPFMPSQLRVLKRILQSVSRAGGRIMTIHSRQAAKAVLEEVKLHGDVGVPVLHWFSGNSDELALAVQRECWFSVGPAMLKSKAGKDRVISMPRNRVLTETDGPFGQINGKPLEPIDVGQAVSALSALWLIPPDEVAALIQDNLKRLLAEAGQQLGV